jgi:hypothetical protein
MFKSSGLKRNLPACFVSPSAYSPGWRATGSAFVPISLSGAVGMVWAGIGISGCGMPGFFAFGWPSP